MNLLAYLFVAILIVLTGRFLYDWFNFGRGHKAFLAGDCFSANRYFDRAISGWRVGDIGSYKAMAEFEMHECETMLEVINLERNGQYSQALQGYLEFLENHPESGLNEAIRNRSTALFAQADPYDLVNEVICTHTTALLEQRLVPQREQYLPELYLSCGHFYTQAKETQQAYAAYVTFLNEYPEHESGSEAEAGLVENPLACEKPDLLRDSPLGKRPDFIPKLYYTCGFNYETTRDFTSAIPMFLRFLREYPEHRFADQITAALARTMVAQATSAQSEILPQPERSRGGGNETAEVSIRNGSPYPLLITFYGIEARVVDLEACEDCLEAASCVKSSPVTEIRLYPGEFQVVIQVNTPDEYQNWLGTWTLETKSNYAVCFMGR